MINASDIRRMKRKDTPHFKRGNRRPAPIEWIDKEITPRSKIFLRVHGILYVADITQDIHDKDWILQIRITEKRTSAEIYRSNSFYDKQELYKDLKLYKIIATDCPKIGIKKMSIDPQWKRIKTR